VLCTKHTGVFFFLLLQSLGEKEKAHCAACNGQLGDDFITQLSNESGQCGVLLAIQAGGSGKSMDNQSSSQMVSSAVQE
jgi:hypothetical protein